MNWFVVTRKQCPRKAAWPGRVLFDGLLWSWIADYVAKCGQWKVEGGGL